MPRPGTAQRAVTPGFLDGSAGGEQPARAADGERLRATVAGRTRVFYDAVDIEGRRRRRIHSAHGWLDEGGEDAVETALSPWLLRVPERWRAPTLTVHERRRWESSPFYARSVGRFESPEGAALGVCEHVDLHRFASPFVRWMLRYRIYRRGGRNEAALPVHVAWRDVPKARG